MAWLQRADQRRVDEPPARVAAIALPADDAGQAPEGGTPSATGGDAVGRAPARVWIFALLAAACLAVAGGYVAWAMLRGGATARNARVEPAVTASGDVGVAVPVPPGPHVVFQHVARNGHYAKVALAPLPQPDEPRTMTGLVCERVYYAAGRGLCLVPERGIVTTYSAYIVGPDFKPGARIPLGGSPSRARISPDGRYGATTVFVFGHSYSDGNFSTQTTLIEMDRAAAIVELEQFEVWRDGALFRSPDFNFWGVTFARDSNRFYATLASGGRTYLVEGDVSARRARVLRENVECPSLSPDNTRLAFKKKVGNEWRLHVLDLPTMVEVPLAAETRSVDDQVEWLDDGQILYGFGADVWVLPVDGSGPPRKFLADALSPAVIR